jgi:nitroimidazol reductase NimA-like FMN-containing flavoprotein (pyridoxamine 5'-phosphate oxidase superfamily)
VTSIDAATGLQVIAREDCVRLLATQEVGRLAMVDGGRPHLVPVNYAMDGECVVFRSFPGTKIARLGRSSVAFEVDELDRTARRGWSVVVHGRAEEVTAWDSADTRARVAGLDLLPWADGDKPHFVRIVPQTITGRRI